MGQEEMSEERRTGGKGGTSRSVTPSWAICCVLEKIFITLLGTYLRGWGARNQTNARMSAMAYVLMFLIARGLGRGCSYY